jgi:hypothetical protein
MLLLLLGLFYLMPFPWRLVLETQSAWLGFLWFGRRIPYESVRLLRADYDGRAEKVVRHRESTTLVVIEAGTRKHVIRLPPAEAQKAVEALQARCRHAAGIDTKGESFLPSDPRDAAAGRRRLRRVWLWQAALGLGMGALGIVCLIVLLTAPAPKVDKSADHAYLKLSDQRLQRQRALVTAGIIGPGGVSYGLLALRRARRFRS